VRNTCAANGLCYRRPSTYAHAIRLFVVHRYRDCPLPADSDSHRYRDCLCRTVIDTHYNSSQSYSIPFGYSHTNALDAHRDRYPPQHPHP